MLPNCWHVEIQKANTVRPPFRRGVSFQDHPRTVKIRENSTLPPKKTMFLYSFLYRNTAIWGGGGYLFFLLSTPWGSCRMPRRPVRDVEQFWCSCPLNGTSDVSFLFLGLSSEFAKPRSTKPQNARNECTRSLWRFIHAQVMLTSCVKFSGFCDCLWDKSGAEGADWFHHSTATHSMQAVSFRTSAKKNATLLTAQKLTYRPGRFAFRSMPTTSVCSIVLLSLQSTLISS